MNQNTETDSLTGGASPPSLTAPPPAPSSMPSDYPPQPASVTSGYGSIETPYVAPTYTWYEALQRNKPQSNSLAAASMIFLSGGMSLAMSVGVGPLSEYGTHAQYCWFIAVIIGACISAFLAHKMKKRVFYLISSILVITKGILYIVFASNPQSWIIFARYCDGLAFGMTIIPAILAGSEQSVKKFRGRVLGVEQSSLSVGAMLLSLFAITWKTEEEINRVIGIASLIYGLLALIYTFATTVESPLFYLRRNNETEALNAQRQLQKPKTITNETYALLEENKILLEEDLNRGIANNFSNSLIPMVEVTILRVLVSLSFSLPLTWGYLVASGLSDKALSDPNPFTYVFMRVLGVTISLLTIDKLGRRITGVVALLIGSILLLGIGTMFNTSEATIGILHAAITFLLIHQILAGIAAPASTCYLGEAFSPSVKPYMILVSIIVENFVQIVVCFQSTFESTPNYAYVLAALQFIYAFIYFFAIPETKHTTLREALEKFRDTVYIRLQGV